MIIVDFYGGPCSGKSTLAAGLFNHLKLEGIDCELVGEVAKTLIYEGRLHLLLPPNGNQMLVTAMQLDRLQSLQRAGCKVAISDSPLPLQLAYVDWNPLKDHIKAAVRDSLKEFSTTISVFCQRGKEFSTFGRYQANIEEAIAFDNKAKDIMNEFGINYSTFEGNREGQERMLSIVTHFIKRYMHEIQA